MDIKVEKKGSFYNITIGGLTVYGCQRKTGTNQKGDYDFISLPQRKAKDEKWYPVVSASKELSEAIFRAVVESEPF